MVRLVSVPDLPGVGPRAAGLFHTAFLFDDRRSLAATVHRAARDGRSRFVGSSDHMVSEAFYFTGPEGNGIELYIDRERSEWTYAPDGELRMATEYLDPNAFLREHLDQSAVDAAPRLPGKVGHVHLQVDDIDRARDFYVDTLGFETTVPAREDLDALVARLKSKGTGFADNGRSVSVKDPWGTQVTGSLPGTGAEDLLKA